jgi:hypothetical protein
MTDIPFRSSAAARFLPPRQLEMVWPPVGILYRSSACDCSVSQPAPHQRHTLWLSACFFGIAHYFGTPGGLAGAILSIFMGWILGKGMTETRGLVWTWWIHFLSDVVIFSFMTMALSK